MGLIATSLFAVPTDKAHAWSKNLVSCKSHALGSGKPHLYATGSGVTSWYGKAIDESSPLWWRAGVRGGFKRGVGEAWHQTYITRAYCLDDWFGRAVYSKCSPDGFYSSSTQIRLNSRTIETVKKFTAWQVKYIIVHEFGHILGLGHTSYTCGVSIMTRDARDLNDPRCASKTPPWNDDMKGYRALYG